MSAILAINSGSSTLKFGLFVEDGADERALVRGAADGIGKPAGKLDIVSGEGESLHSEQAPIETQQTAATRIGGTLRRLGFPLPVAVAHRIVHGGPRLRDHVRITPDVIAALEAALHFAPVHIPTALALIRHVSEIFPDMPQFACFDTAFHKTLPPEAYHYP